MKFAFALSTLCVVLGFTGSAMAEPYSPSCEIALERIDTDQKSLVPFRRTMEMAKAHDDGAHGEAEACIAGSQYALDKSIYCQKSKWQAPKPNKYELTAVDQYHQKRKEFEELFKQAKQICLDDPSPRNLR